MTNQSKFTSTKFNFDKSLFSTSVNLLQISANYVKCFVSAITVPLPLFKGKLFVAAIIGTYSLNSLLSLLYFKELVAFGSSNFTHTELQSGLDLMSKCFTVKIERLINLSVTLISQHYPCTFAT